MDGNSASRNSSFPGTVRVNQKQSWATSPSGALYHFGTSGISVAVATGLTHPLDVLKVRLQMQLVGQRGPLIGMGPLCIQVLKNEGPKSLYLGLTPALTRSLLYGGLRLGLYEPSKYACDWAFGSTNILVKVVSGAFAGAISTAITNPVEVVKVRLQMNTDLRKRGPITEVRSIVANEGIGALWKGVGAATARAAALTASQLATYDESKQLLVKWMRLEEGFCLHLASSTIAGLLSTLITAPIDMVKTRLMLQRESGGRYKNGFHCAYKWGLLDILFVLTIRTEVGHGSIAESFYQKQKVLRTEGPRGLYKGGFAIFARLGPQTTITFILCEKLRKLVGLNAI